MRTIFIFLVWVVGTTNVIASDEYDTNEIRQMVAQGEILSLDEILDLNPMPKGSRLLDLEVEYEYGRIVYELKLLTGRSRVEEWYIDAKNGELLKKKLKKKKKKKYKNKDRH